MNEILVFGGIMKDTAGAYDTILKSITPKSFSIHDLTARTFGGREWESTVFGAMNIVQV